MAIHRWLSGWQLLLRQADRRPTQMEARSALRDCVLAERCCPGPRHSRPMTRRTWWNPSSHRCKLYCTFLRARGLIRRASCHRNTVCHPLYPRRRALALGKSQCIENWSSHPAHSTTGRHSEPCLYCQHSNQRTVVRLSLRVALGS